MLPTAIANQILSVGPDYLPPKGGIAQTVFNYNKHIFPKSQFRYVANSCDGSRVKKIYRLISSVVIFCCKLLFNRAIQVIHIHTASNFSFKRSAWFVNIARLFGKKIILHIHGGGFKDYFYRGNELFVNRVLNKCDRVVVLSNGWEQWFRNEVKCEKVRVVPNVIPVPQPIESKRNDSTFHVLFLGLINEEKGIFDLVRAVAENRKRLLNRFQLHIAGNGMVERLEAEIQERDLQELIKYEGWVDSIAKHKLLSTCNALVLPSYTEGLPLSILEAMSYRMPIITTPVGGIPSVIEDGTNGFLIEPGNGEGFIEKIIQLIENRSIAKVMGEESYKRIDNHFPVSVSAVLMKIYKELID